MNDKMQSSGSILFLPHGGGPLPLLGDPGHQAMVDFLQSAPKQLIKPSAILLVSAHWEQAIASLTAAAHPQLIYDYYGFADEAYQITYPAPGDPPLTNTISELLQQHSIEHLLDSKRGFDHGLFVPLKIMYPDADIPCVQLSLLKSLDPQDHINLGRALRSLKQHNILIIGSGFSFHNLPAFFRNKGSDKSDREDAQNDAFHDWLNQSCVDATLSEAEREALLINWESAPYARYCHPREEHLLPLHVCYGAALQPARCVFDERVLGKRCSAYMW